MSLSVNEKLLSACYHDATRKDGLIDFTSKIRTEKNDLSGKFFVKQNDLTRLFSKDAWSELKTGSGHRKIDNKVTHVVIEYKNHTKDIDPGAVETIFNAVQDHLNILSNKVFLYSQNHWKSAPDYKSAINRLKALDAG
jgi:hypothetical protein